VAYVTVQTFIAVILHRLKWCIIAELRLHLYVVCSYLWLHWFLGNHRNLSVSITMIALPYGVCYFVDWCLFWEIYICIQQRNSRMSVCLCVMFINKHRLSSNPFGFLIFDTRFSSDWTWLARLDHIIHMSYICVNCLFVYLTFFLLCGRCCHQVQCATAHSLMG